MSTRTLRAPFVIVFDHAPGEHELALPLGPPVVVGRVGWREDDERIIVDSAPPVRVRRITAVLVVVFGTIGFLPWILSSFGWGRRIDAWLAIAAAVAVWLGIALVVRQIRVLARQRAALGPGAIVIRRTGELELPWIARKVAARDLDRFVEVYFARSVGHLREPRAQYGVVFREGAGHYAYTVFARVAGRPFGASCARRLADFYDLPCQRVRG